MQPYMKVLVPRHPGSDQTDCMRVREASTERPRVSHRGIPQVGGPRVVILVSAAAFVDRGVFVTR